MDAAELIDRLRQEAQNRSADAVARTFLREQVGDLDRDKLRRLVAYLYPPASPGQDGWSSFVTDYTPAVDIEEASR